jgi:hypothetical protein
LQGFSVDSGSGSGSPPTGPVVFTAGTVNGRLGVADARMQALTPGSRRWHEREARGCSWRRGRETLPSTSSSGRGRSTARSARPSRSTSSTGCLLSCPNGRLRATVAGGRASDGHRCRCCSAWPV